MATCEGGRRSFLSLFLTVSGQRLTYGKKVFRGLSVLALCLVSFFLPAFGVDYSGASLQCITVSREPDVSFFLQSMVDENATVGG